jgi:hypothetical protein
VGARASGGRAACVPLLSRGCVRLPQRDPCQHQPRHDACHATPAAGFGSRGGSELAGANGDAADTAHTRGSTPGPSSQGAAGDSDGAAAAGAGAARRSGLAPKSRDEAAQMVSKLGSQRINNIFTHLRKICQHPLLVRNIFTDEKVRS